MTVFDSYSEAPPSEFVVVGDPIRHSLSPRMHGAALRHLGLPHRYIAIRVEEQAFDAAMDALRDRGTIGVNVTVPHKEAARRWASEVDGPDYGVMNTLRLADRTCTNTDVPGFLDTLRELNVTLPCRVLLLGAGGTARALVQGLVQEGCEVLVWNRTASRAAKMVREVAPSARVVSRLDPTGADLVLNTTSASLQEEGLSVEWSRAPDGCVAYDAAYGDGLTAFLRSAEAFGLRLVDGRGLLVAQGARSLTWWLGVEAPRAVMLEAIR